MTAYLETVLYYVGRTRSIYRKCMLNSAASIKEMEIYVGINVNQMTCFDFQISSSIKSFARQKQKYFSLCRQEFYEM